MYIEELVNNIDCEIYNNKSYNITMLTHKSCNIKNGGCYVCLKGVQDGHNYVNEAISQGAVAIIADKSYDANKVSADVMIIKVNDTRKTYAMIASKFFDEPSKKIKVIGVTGTNGKTSTCKIIYDILTALGNKVGYIGTLDSVINGEKIPSELTTPDPVELQNLLSLMVEKNCKYAVMEVSAHAIELSKIAGVKFEIVCFTNFTQDHLDYFGTMEKYKAAKQKLFYNSMSDAVINIDDKCGREIIELAKVNKLHTYGINCHADLQAHDIVVLPSVKFAINFEGNKQIISSNLSGKFNVYNLLCAISAVKALGYNIGDIANGVGSVKVIDGRYEMRVFDGVAIIIDYAHTPDGLQNILSESRSMTNGKLYCVFGCGGDRDKIKRPIMGKIACEYCDKVFITSDNPRFENRYSIINDIFKGIKQRHKAYKFPKRYYAIAHACRQAKAGDTIVIAGKGHEQYIEEKGLKIPYSDINSVEVALGVKW